MLPLKSKLRTMGSFLLPLETCWVSAYTFKMGIFTSFFQNHHIWDGNIALKCHLSIFRSFEQVQ